MSNLKINKSCYRFEEPIVENRNILANRKMMINESAIEALEVTYPDESFDCEVGLFV